MPGIFIAGTDTGVGKTVVSSGLIKLARKRGINCVGVKPVETGCPIASGMLQPIDGKILWEAGERAFSLDDCAPYRFALPAAPYRSAAMENRNLKVADIVEHILALAEDAEMLIVEGAGGLMTPVEEAKSMIDIIFDLKFPTILVAKMSLGTINHSLLSVEALEKRGIKLKALILSSTNQNPGPEEEYTPKDLSCILRDIPVAVLPFIENAGNSAPSKVAELMAENWPDSFVDQIFYNF